MHYIQSISKMLGQTLTMTEKRSLCKYMSVNQWSLRLIEILDLKINTLTV